MSQFDRPVVSAVILAGGRFTRMRRDKTWIEREGRPLVVRVVPRDAPCFANWNRPEDVALA